ncbi:MAG TPA: lysophospholipid acyltransferase family protein [Chthonomonadaceae bacterium]|nr:lysophospholipid acyltransferase family protein [Chthonomonadaceae bacterium]
MTRPREWRPHPHAGHTFLYHLAGRALRLFFRLYGRWQVVGRENVPREGGVLLAANHASYLDPPILGASLYRVRRVWFLAKSELWQNPMLAFLLGHVLARPLQRHTADRATLKQALEWLAQGDAVAMFPEGERTRTGNLQPGQPGIALLAQKSGAPVVPVAILGTYAMLPAHRKSLQRAPLKVVFGAPMTFRPKAAREEVTAAIMQAIAALMTAHGQPTGPPAPSMEATPCP